MILQGIRDLIFIRHGESKRNLSENKGPFYKNNADREAVGILQDRLMPLTKKGHQQARNAGRALKRKFGEPDLVFYSGFLRTHETVNGIIKAYSYEEWLQIKIMENHLIRERNPGYLMNYTETEIQEMFPWWRDYWYTVDKFSVIPFGGESIASMAEGRLLTFLKSLEEVSRKKGGSKIFVVSHGRAILGMRYLLEDWSYERIISALSNENPPNCSATHYKFDAFGNPHLQFANHIF